MMKRFDKKENLGITLVALVITIIVLLILAGITISQISNNGLFDKSKQAKEQYQNAQDLENSIIENYEKEIAENSRDTVTITTEEYNKLKKDATTIVVTSTLPAKSGDWVKISNYPDSYSKSSLYLKTFEYNVNGKFDTSYFGAQFQLRDDGIYYWANEFGRWGCPITLYFGLK